MHYYTFKPKDYMSKTAFLEPLEDLAYRRMLDHCYLTEKPLPEDINEIAMLIRMRSHTDSIKTVLHYFFDLTAEGYINDYVARELLAYHSKSLKAKASADARWKKERNKIKDISNVKSQCESNANALREESEGNANQQPLTINDKPLTNNIDTPSGKPKKSKNVLRTLPDDFCISERVKNWAIKENHQNIELHLERFKEIAIMKRYKYADWDLAFMKAIREDWGKVNTLSRHNNGYQTSQQRTEAEHDKWRLACEPQNNFIDVSPMDQWQGFLNESN